MSRKQAKVPAEYLPVFCRELYQIVHAGIIPAEGLSMLKEEESDPAVLSWLTTLCELTDAGTPLAEALKETAVFPEYMTDMIDLAERTGKLEDTLLSLQRHYDRQNRLRSDVVSAITVPVVLLVVMLAVVILLITRVLPVFDRVFAQMGVQMGAAASGMMRAGAALAKAGTWLAIVIGVLAVAAILVAAVPSLRRGFSAWFRSRFGDKGILGRIAVTRFGSSMAVATASGLSMDEAVDLAAKLSGGAKKMDAMTQRCREMVDEGCSTADALSESGLFSGRDAMMLKLAERTGNLSETLEDIAARQEEGTLRKIDRMVSMIEPAIVVLTSALAGVILLSVMLPLMGLLSTI